MNTKIKDILVLLEKSVLKEESSDDRYPELIKIANKIARETINSILIEVKSVETKMPYKAQFVLEEITKILESKI